MSVTTEIAIAEVIQEDQDDVRHRAGRRNGKSGGGGHAAAFQHTSSANHSSISQRRFCCAFSLIEISRVMGRVYLFHGAETRTAVEAGTLPKGSTLGLVLLAKAPAFRKRLALGSKLPQEAPRRNPSERTRTREPTAPAKRRVVGRRHIEYRIRLLGTAVVMILCCTPAHARADVSFDPGFGSVGIGQLLRKGVGGYQAQTVREAFADLYQ